MGNSSKSVQKQGQSKNVKNSKSLQLLPELPEMYIPVSEDIVQHPDETSLKIYTILMNKNQLELYKQSLAFRKQHTDEIIQVHYGQFLKDQQQYYKIRVYIQHIQFNLQNFSNLHFFDLMAIFHKVFKGFKYLYENFGCFDVDPRMIGFTQKAEVKVWCNIKYSRATPKSTYHLLDEKKMLQSLIQIFMNKVDLGTVPINSHSRRFKLEAETFDQAIRVIEDQVQSVDLIPKEINSIKNLMTSGRKIDPNEVVSMNSEVYLKNIDKTIKFNYSNPTKDMTLQPKVCFTFGRSNSVGNHRNSNPRNISSSKPKITFSHNTQNTEQKKPVRNPSQVKINFTATNPSIGDKSRIIITPREADSKKVESLKISKCSSSKTIKRQNNTAPRIKFTYN